MALSVRAARRRPLVHEHLISVAGLLGRPVRNGAGAEIGRIADVVVRWGDAPYPPVSGLVVRVARRRAFVASELIAAIDPSGATLRSARLDLRDFVARDGEVALATHVIDHQLVDVDGVRVVRASDLYLAPVAGAVRLVGVDVGMQTLLRRLGPRRWRSIPTPTRVIDWAAIQPLTAPGGAVRLTAAHAGLRRLRPADLADLLEELGRDQRRHLLGALDDDVAAEALEEMDDDERDQLLREMPPERVAALLEEMAPDEAADALRDLDDDERAAILAQLSPPAAAELGMLAAFAEGTAGAAMTTVLVRATPDRTVTDVVRDLREVAADRLDIDGVLVVDGEGRLLDDVTLFELLVAPAGATLGELVADPLPETVHADDPLALVVQTFVDNRGTSIIVVDGDARPVGRILADDMLDVLLEDTRLPQLVRGLS
ncbi:MAG: CBS domain-containing protein [Ilumatobacteraceae bacterium]